MIVVKIMPMMIAPFTFKHSKTIVMIRPMIATSAAPFIGTKPMIVPVSPETMPPPCRPMSVINKPMPTATAFFKFAGIALMSAWRTLKIDKTINKMPSRKTAVSAVCHE